MSPIEAALLGLLQGLTEFLPVSSSGHLVLAQALLGLELQGVGFEVALHVATLFAVLWVYRRRVVSLASGLVQGKREAVTYVGLLMLASLPAAAAGILARPLFEDAFERPALVAALLLVSGAFAWSIGRSAREERVGQAHRDRPGPVGAMAVGVAQAFAILPGISRSGSTVAVGARTGVEVVRMAEFSFLLSVPAVAGAALLQATDPAGAAFLRVTGPVGVSGGIGWFALAVGFTVALVTGVLAIRLFLRALSAGHFGWFAHYCWLLGGGYLIAAAARPGLR